jgi:hypothetical protein
MLIVETRYSSKLQFPLYPQKKRHESFYITIIDFSAIFETFRVTKAHGAKEGAVGLGFAGVRVNCSWIGIVDMLGRTHIRR